ncbi:MAG TPA: methyltransferase [Microbacterium sp.]|uniref:class I SAM-dependent methyltransferase n=1 Tax=Microbacterium sp. TaxID=51671 RepID=UPI002B4A8930|nr:methyltransferase [Microbacterium sp.]HKT56081.1 methyltransferase [Microbacterium sp.]
MPHDIPTDDTWSGDVLADRFLDAYDTAKGYVRTAVMHRQLMEHLPPAPATVLDVGGGAGTQSFPLAAAGHEVTLLDSSPAMLDRARERLARLPDAAAGRVTLLEADGTDAAASVDGRTFDAVLCHGVLGYLDDPAAMVDQLCRCTAPGGIVSIMTGNARASAVQPALEQRWADALAAFDEREGVGVLGVRGRADTVAELGELLRAGGVEPLDWYGVWLFADWLEFGGTTVDVSDPERLRAMAEVEFEAARRDPYRQLSRVFHLLGRKG